MEIPDHVILDVYAKLKEALNILEPYVDSQHSVTVESVIGSAFDGFHPAARIGIAQSILWCIDHKSDTPRKVIIDE